MASQEQAREIAATALRSPRSFVTTDWSLVVGAAQSGNDDGRVALEELCRIYWPPLYAFARHQGVSTADAEDLTQGFFQDLLERNALTFADPMRGRFRSFLLTSFRHYHSKQIRRSQATKRGGGRLLVPLEAMREYEVRLSLEFQSTKAPDKLFDQRWATQLLGLAISTVRREYEAIGKVALFDELKGSLWSGSGGKSYAEIARLFDTTQSAIKAAAHRLRRRVGERFREEVARTVDQPEAVDGEIQHLLAAVSD